MAVRKKKVEVHRLTMSGVPGGMTYGQLLRQARNAFDDLEDLVLEMRDKSHALFEVKIVGGRLRLLFMSFRTGYRPDILDVADYSLAPTPLGETETAVEWTHCLGGRVSGRYLLLVEKGQGGIWPKTLEDYVQWLVDQFELEDEDEDADEPIVVSLEPLADESFVTRLETLDRIQHATVRIVRPNPGWWDLESELGEQADASDAAKADVAMHARRGASLAKDDGIVAAIKESVATGELAYARVEGQREGVAEGFDTARFGQAHRVEFELDEFGQVKHADAWKKLAHVFKSLT